MDISIESASKNLENILNIFIKNRCVLSNEMISELIQITDFYKHAEPEKRTEFRENIKTDYRQYLIILSDYFADAAINQRSYQYLYAAMILIAIEDFEWDYRESIIRLAVVWYTAQELGTKPEHLFDEISSISSAKATNFLSEFVSRPEKSKSLNSMGLTAQKTGDKILIIPKPPPWETRTKT